MRDLFDCIIFVGNATVICLLCHYASYGLTVKFINLGFKRKLFTSRDCLRFWLTFILSFLLLFPLQRLGINVNDPEGGNFAIRLIGSLFVGSVNYFIFKLRMKIRR
jgi:hypothetical protein